MDLWIRSQDRECLMKVDRVDYSLSSIEHRIYVNGYETLVGHYATEERALEVLDEISNKIKNQFIVKEKTMLKPKDLMHHKKWLEYEYNSDFIMQDISCEIQPINSGIVYYEMPEE